MLGHNSLNIAAYSARLLHLVTYLQQLEMESLGKRVAGDGQAVGVPSAPIIWGMPGTDGQHTFFQWLHQSENGAPVDFIASLQGCPDNPDAHRMLLANCLAQRQALLRGKSLEQALLDVAHIDDRERALRLARHMVHPGGRPSSLIVLRKLDPRGLGALLACTSTRCSCRAWSGASIPSTNGAWSWASGWPPASSASWRCRCRRPWPTGARRVHVVLDRLLPGPRPAAAAPCLGAGRRGASVSGARGPAPRDDPCRITPTPCRGFREEAPAVTVDGNIAKQHRPVGQSGGRCSVSEALHVRPSFPRRRRRHFLAGAAMSRPSHTTPAHWNLDGIVSGLREARLAWRGPRGRLREDAGLREFPSQESLRQIVRI